MAKKAKKAKKATKAKKAKKATKTTKKAVSDRTLEAILVECAIAVGVGIGAMVTLSEEARKLWHSDFRKSIKKALSNGEKWSEGRKLVIPLSTKMGTHAAMLAGSSGTISKADAQQAADEIRKDPACPPGSGKFCD